MLDGHELCWHKRGQDGSGKCDVIATGCTGDRVHGVVYEIALAEKPALDAAEGLGKGYDQKQVLVEQAGRMLFVQLYVATSIDAGLLPFSWYRALVIAGAKDNGLPSEYLARLMAVPALPDPDRNRHAMNMAIVADS